MSNDLVNYCEEKINEMKNKANHNKNETLWSFRIIMISTLAVPLFISFGDSNLLSKVIPSILSAISAFSTAWVQLRKPNQLWSLYRTAQRELENELDLYKFNSKKYSEVEHKEQLLIEEFFSKYYEVNDEWKKLVPKAEDALIKKNK